MERCRGRFNNTNVKHSNLFRLQFEKPKQAAFKLTDLFSRKCKKLERRTDSDGQKIHIKKKGQSQKELWGSDVQSMSQRPEEKRTSEAAKPLEKPTPVVSVKTQVPVHTVVDFTVTSENFQKRKLLL